MKARLFALMFFVFAWTMFGQQTQSFELGPNSYPVKVVQHYTGVDDASKYSKYHYFGCDGKELALFNEHGVVNKSLEGNLADCTKIEIPVADILPQFLNSGKSVSPASPASSLRAGANTDKSPAQLPPANSPNTSSLRLSGSFHEATQEQPYVERFTASGGTGTGYRYAAIGLPANMSMDAITGYVEGTPRNNTIKDLQADAIPVTVTVKDSAGNVAELKLKLKISPSYASTGGLTLPAVPFSFEDGFGACLIISAAVMFFIVLKSKPSYATTAALSASDEFQDVPLRVRQFDPTAAAIRAKYEGNIPPLVPRLAIAAV